MRILTRYVLKEYLIPFCYCMAGFVSIYVLFELFGSFSRLMDSGLPFRMMAEYFCAYLAPYVEWLVPAALMLSALYTMWSFCRHSELIAMRASGVSFFAIARPMLAVAFVMSLAVMFVNEWYVPRRAQWAKQMKTEKFNLQKLERADNIVYRNVRDCRTWTVGKVVTPDAEHLADVRVTIDRPGGARRLSVSAPKVDYLDGEWWFSDAEIQHYDINGVETSTPTPELDSLSLRAFPEFLEKPKDFLAQNRDWTYNSIADRIRYLRTHRNLSAEVRRKYAYDTWAKVFSPFACIIITLFAIPAGVATGRQSVFKGILGALGLFFAFYGAVIGCMVCANEGWLNPALAAVLPYALFLVLGIRAFNKQR